MEKRQIQIDKELNAIVEYDDAFRLILSHDDLSEYHKGFVNWHKQPMIEISVVVEGAVNVYVLEREQIVTKGDGFFIMPGFLHSIRPAPGYQAAKYFTLIFYPEILYGVQGSYYEKEYYRPIVDANTPFFLFKRCETWTAEIFPKLEWIADNFSEMPEFRLKTQHILQNIWTLFAANLPGQEKTSSALHDNRKILNLVTWLHTHYQEKFSLAMLAESMSMSRNECCRYFKRMMNMTITEYLLEYRLSKAAALLESSDLSITEISERTGFCDVSYFIKMFRRKTGITPKAYAKKFY
ncbi:MAG: AraC family transcriptional regulator [Clostridium sp.]|nr:AraC family transcriptional regulator [Clostridium sp.]